MSSIVPEMPYNPDPNFNAHKEPPLDAIDVRNLSRAVLGRAIMDLLGTADYSKPRMTKVPGAESATSAMEIGEEVRKWFQDTESEDVFSYRFCCEHSGYNERDIDKFIAPYMVPKHRERATWMELPRVMVDYLRANPVCSHSKFILHFRSSKYHPTAVRRCLYKLKEQGIIYTVRRDTVTHKNVQHWELREEYR